MYDEFDFVLGNKSDLTVFHASQLGDGEMYRVSWNEDKEFVLYLPQHVQGHLDNGDWVKIVD